MRNPGKGCTALVDDPNALALALCSGGSPPLHELRIVAGVRRSSGVRATDSWPDVAILPARVAGGSGRRPRRQAMGGPSLALVRVTACRHGWSRGRGRSAERRSSAYCSGTSGKVVMCSTYIPAVVARRRRLLTPQSVQALRSMDLPATGPSFMVGSIRSAATSSCSVGRGCTRIGDSTADIEPIDDRCVE
jgi:hypothetical protein